MANEASVLNTDGAVTTAVGHLPGTATLAGGVALVAFATESPHHTRSDVHFADVARTLRRSGCPSRVFNVHLTGTDHKENGRRVERLLARLIEERCRWAVFHEVWTPELGRDLRAAGIRLIETRTHTIDSAIFSKESDILTHVNECRTERPLNELADLVETVGPRDVHPITSIDLRIQQACGYMSAVADNEFYRDIRDTSVVASHRGCTYCMGAREYSGSSPEDAAARIVERIRSDRQVFPAVETFWMAYAETFYDALGVALRTTGDDPLWRGITLSMQCRPDAIARRADEIVALAGHAAAAGTRLRIGVVGFENFSPREILVLNRGVTPEVLDTAATILNRWLAHPPTGLVVAGFTPSFILFTPWTQIEDLEINLQRIALHGLWNANIERLRFGPGTPVFEKARRDGLVIDRPVRTAAHPNGYSSEREIRFADARAGAVAAGFERLRPLAFSEQPELLAGIVTAVCAESDPAGLDWENVARAWDDLGAAAHGS